MNSERVQDLGDKIIAMLKTIYDPEIPVDIFELGLIYDVMVSENNDVKILMTDSGFYPESGHDNQHQ